MSNYLSGAEIAVLVGCRENSFACMRRWLTRNKWPFEVSISGFPIVGRAYHDARMSGIATDKGKIKVRVEPNFGALA